MNISRRKTLQPPADFFAGVDHAASRVQNDPFVSRRLNFVEDFAHRFNFAGKIFLLAFAIIGLVRPAHPRSDSAEAAVLAGAQFVSKFSLNTIVNADRPESSAGKFTSPVGFARSGHSDE